MSNQATVLQFQAYKWYGDMRKILLQIVIDPVVLPRKLHSTLWPDFCFIAHNFKAVLCSYSLETRNGYGYCEYCTHLKIGCFMPQLGAPLFQVRTSLLFLMLDFFRHPYKPRISPKAFGVVAAASNFGSPPPHIISQSTIYFTEVYISGYTLLELQADYTYYRMLGVNLVSAQGVNQTLGRLPSICIASHGMSVTITWEQK